MSTKIDQAQAALHAQLEESNRERKTMFGMIRKHLDGITFSSNDSPGSIEAKLLLFSTADGLLKSADAAAMNQVKILIQKADSDHCGAAAGMITELLKQVRATGTPGNAMPNNDHHAEATLEARAAAECAPIASGESEAASEVHADAAQLPGHLKKKNDSDDVD
jgi:hypothetical protein